MNRTHVTSDIKSIDQEVLTEREQRIYDFLKSTPVAVLSTVNNRCEPHGSVIYFTVSPKFQISFLTKAETQKYQNIQANPHVMFTVFDAPTQTTAQITGLAREITDGATIDEIARANMLASLDSTDSDIPPIAKLRAGKHVAFAVTPTDIHMAVYARPDNGDPMEQFESLQSFDIETADIRSY